MTPTTATEDARAPIFPMQQRIIAQAFADARYAPTLKNGRPNPQHDPAYREQVLHRLQAGMTTEFTQ